MQKNIPIEIKAIGNIESYATVSIKARVNGELQKVHFTEGQEVSKGKLLFTIDPKPFQAALEDERKNNKSLREVIFEGCLVRFRPIMMTTMAAIIGTLPIAIGFGAGTEARRPLGLAIVGGFVFSQHLTLYITPVYFFYLDGLKKRILSLFQRNES